MTTSLRPDLLLAPCVPRPADGQPQRACGVLKDPVWLLIDSPAASRAPQPVTVGVPLPCGYLREATALSLLDRAGQPVPLQALPLARWADGSVKWLLLDFVLQGVTAGQTLWELGPKARQVEEGAAAVRIQESGRRIVVDTGAAMFHLDRESLPPLRQVVLAGQDVLAPEAAGVILKDERGRLGKPKVERAVFEARGPVRATLRLEGRFAGGAPSRFVARLCFFAGTGLVRFRLTLHNPRRARHRGGLWDLGDAGSILLRELALTIALKGDAPPRVRWEAEPGVNSGPAEGVGMLEIYQDSSGGANWQSKNHVDRTGRVPCVLRGYRVRQGGREWTGLRASPLVSVERAGGALGVAVPEFWQQFPRALEVQDGVVKMGLFPAQFQGPFELQGGEQKTHTVWLHLGPARPELASPLAWVHHPARVHATPEWYAGSGAVPHLLPAAAAPHPRLDAFLAEILDGENSLPARREVIDEYGWRHFGEVYADHEAEHYDGPPPLISHYNNQYDLLGGAIIQYLRTGDGRWFDLFDPLARHVIDIDIYHTDRDRAAYNGGLFWFTDHYKSAATCTHRTYSKANCRPGDRSYGGGPSSNHNFTTGLLHYHFLTGDPAAREAVLSLADWVVNMDDGRKTILGLIDDGPTGLASCTSSLHYHGPGRGAGNSVNALLDAWILTQRRGYLDKAEQLIRRCIHPADDVEARDLLNAEKRWSYTVFLVALARYLHLKAESGELDFMYAYAQASLLHYAAWMVDNEVPYFDHPEKLEYPTEAWAGQEFRKANVLRLTAAHADEPLRSRLVRRGQELAERAWSDLLRFASRTSARGAALVMAEGPLDAASRIAPPAPASCPADEPDFGTPEAFVPQKTRVLTQLRTCRGLLRTVLRLVNPCNWARFLAARRRSSGNP